MTYKKFCKILNKHIFEGRKKELLESIAKNPERFIGLFRPTKPMAKLLQHLLQSQEIRMGDALEEIKEEIFKMLGFKVLNNVIENEKGETLILDHYLFDGKKYYFIEEKVRDDHDSTKKRGQISNFKEKLTILFKEHKSNLCGIMYFIDPSLRKNKNYYQKELNKLKEKYHIPLFLFYGKELFDYLKHPEIWENIILWLKKWKDSLPTLPEINFDKEPEKSFEEIKQLNPLVWEKILENENLWEEGIIKVLFREGKTLQLLLEFFKKENKKNYQRLAELLVERIKKYYS